MVLELLGALVVFILFYLVYLYNKFISLRTRVQRAWSQIDVFLKRRYDLIPNLVETVKSYSKYEKQTLVAITKNRAGLIDGTLASRSEKNKVVSSALKTIFAVAESYPDLKASENFLKLQDELVATENSIAYVRIGYNDDVLEYNIMVNSFPSNFMAKMLGLNAMEFFGASPEEKEGIKIDI